MKPLVSKWKEELRTACDVVIGCMTQTVHAAMDLGRQMAYARASLGPAAFKSLFVGDDALPITLQWARRLMVLALNPAIVRMGNRLPGSLAALVQLAVLTEPEIEAGLRSGEIGAGTTQSGAVAFVRSKRGRLRSGVKVPDDVFVDRTLAWLRGRLRIAKRDRPAVLAGLVAGLRGVLDGASPS